jgi:hypothetical protein
VLTALRHGLAILLLPTMVTIVGRRWILVAFATRDSRWPEDSWSWIARTLGLWALTFIALNHIHFLLVEEPGLERRFGDAYLEDKRAVPRWIPRVGGRSAAQAQHQHAERDEPDA